MTVKHEPLPFPCDLEDTTTVAPRHAHATPLLCSYGGRTCPNVRATKRNGAQHSLCETHRTQATNLQRRKQQRDRLLRYLVTALQEDDPISTGMPEHDARPRERPRLVLLGNQQTLILGVVLSDRGASAAAGLAGLHM